MPVYEMGRAAAELLLKQIAEDPTEADEIKIKGQLFVRETCRADEMHRTQDELTLPALESGSEGVAPALLS